MKVGVLSVQGAFAEHIRIFQQFGIETLELRQKSDVLKQYDALVLPGGESTVQGRLLYQLDMYEELRNRIKGGMPVMATCAGLILLADKIENDAHTYFQTLPVTVKRNAYGRQLGSFHTIGTMKGGEEVPMTFIRAPYITRAEDDVTVLAEVDEHMVAVQYKNQLAMAFHPELDAVTNLYERFISLI